MERDGITVTNGHAGSADNRSVTSNARGTVGIYGRGMKSVPKSRSSRSPFMKRHAKKVVGLFVVIAAVILVSALMPLGKGDSAKPESKDAVATRAPPQFAFAVLGYCWDTVENGTPMAGCSVTVTNTNTSESETYVTDVDGFYNIDISNTNPNFPTGYTDGDIINVTAVKGTYMGWATDGVVDTTAYVYLYKDITLTDIGVIPEFPMIIVPVLGMAAMVAIVSLRRRRAEL